MEKQRPVTGGRCDGEDGVVGVGDDGVGGDDEEGV
jgi:hypothetical protein